MKNHKSTSTKITTVTIKLTANEHTLVNAAVMDRVRWLISRIKNSEMFLDHGTEGERASRARNHQNLVSRLEVARAAAKTLGCEMP